MKTLAWFLTAAAILIGADVFTSSAALSPDEAVVESGENSPAGGSGMPDTPPPDLQ